jgi:hypothetical protein
MDVAENVFIQSGKVHYKAEIDVVGLGDEEGWGEPLCGLWEGHDDVFFCEVV